MQLLKFRYVFILLGIFAVLSSCDNDDDDTIVNVTISGITAAGTDLMTGNATTVDLNGATSAVDVPLDAVITITFSKEVDAATATSANISLSQSGTNITTTVDVAASVVTITPSAELERGLVYDLSLSAAIAATDGGAFTAIDRSFTAAGKAGIVPPNDVDQTAYFGFNGNSNSTVGNFQGSAIAVEFREDRFGNQESAAYFDGDVSLIEVPNGDQLMTQSMTISYWMKIDTTDHLNTPGTGLAGHFVMGIGDVYGFFIEVTSNLQGIKKTARYTRDDGTTTANDFFINADGKDGMNGGWVGVEFEKDLTSSGGFAPILQDQWVHILFTWDHTSLKRSFYLNGELIETDNFNLTTGLLNITGMTFDDSDAGTDIIGKSLAFGFNHDQATTHWDDTNWGDYDKPGANHFKGALDDVRFFSTSFNQAEVTDLYNAER